jgi:hypothetical protein
MLGNRCHNPLKGKPGTQPGKSPASWYCRAHDAQGVLCCPNSMSAFGKHRVRKDPSKTHRLVQQRDADSWHCDVLKTTRSNSQAVKHAARPYITKNAEHALECAYVSHRFSHALVRQLYSACTALAVAATHCTGER